jgi:poly(beta-D-mannuronate) C5 epimerase
MNQLMMGITFITISLFAWLFLYAFSFSSSGSFSPYFQALYASSSSEESSPYPSSFSYYNCIEYDPEMQKIKILCESANLTDIRNLIAAPDILHENNKGIWSLNAGIEITKNSTLFINSTDTSWLKIIGNGDGKSPHVIHVFGSLKIDSVKLTSWNSSTNDYARSQDSDRDGKDVNIGTPRPYIVVDNEATGTTDITNSEIAYLGYESGYGGGRTGLRYEGGHGSTLSGNNIHHLYFGLYTREVGGMLIENNHIHHNIHYGLDPHTGTHDMTIRNNTVHDNGSIGIICSLDCYGILIEGNEVYNNTKMGIMFSRNMYDSVARDNIINNEDRGIVISESHNNEIYDNIVSDSGSGIDVDDESFENVVYDNIVSDSGSGIDVESFENVVYDNIVSNNREIHEDAMDDKEDGDVNDQMMKNKYMVSYHVSEVK